MAYHFTDKNNMVGKRTRQVYFTELQDAVDDLDTRVDEVDGDLSTLAQKVVKNIRVTKHPIGFPNRVDSKLSFDKDTREFKIEPVNSEYKVYFMDKEFVKDSVETVIIPDTTGVHFIYFDKNSGEIKTSTSIPAYDNMIYVSYIYWNEEQAVAELQFSHGDERHGTVMDKETHAYIHQVIGAEWIRGLQLAYQTGLQTEIGIKVSMNSGLVRDEDLAHSINHNANPNKNFEQILEGVAKLPVMYRQGNSFVQDEATEYPFKNTNSGRVNYNKNDDGAWSQSEVDDGNYVAYFIVYTGLVEEPIKVIQGEHQSVTLADAQDKNDHRRIDWGNMPFQEFKVLYRMIIKTDDAYSNSRKASIAEVLDLRVERKLPSGGTGGGIIPTAHSNMTGLSYEASGHTGFASQAGVDILDDKIDILTGLRVAVGNTEPQDTVFWLDTTI